MLFRSVNIVKRIKMNGLWKMFSIPRNAKGNYDWNAIADLLCRMVRRRNATARGRRRYCRPGPRGARRKRHELEGRNPGVPGFEKAGETVKKPPLHVAVAKYLEQIEALKKPNTHRKYEAVLERFLDFFRDRDSIDAITSDDLTRFGREIGRAHV